MRLDDERPSSNIEDARGSRGGFGFPGGGGGRRINIPMGGGRGGGFSIKTIIFLVIIYFVLKMLGIDLLQVLNGGGIPVPGGTDVTQTDTGTGGGGTTTTAGTDAQKDFVARVLGTTERVWNDEFKRMGMTYQEPKLTLFSGQVQSACGFAQAAMGPFYCPGDQKVYIDLSFYNDLQNKLGAPGDFAQAYVIGHEVGHHVQNLLGIASKVAAQRMRVSEAEGNELSVRMELQADCLAGFWAQKANEGRNILEPGDLEEGLRAAAAIGDDRLQKRSQGYVVPESFTHGSSEQRVNWLKTGLQANDIGACDTFGTNNL